MLSQFFILSPRGDTIVFRDCIQHTHTLTILDSVKAHLVVVRLSGHNHPACGCSDSRWSALTECEDRGEGAKGVTEIFFKLIKTWKDSKGTYPPPFLVRVSLSLPPCVTK